MNNPLRHNAKILAFGCMFWLLVFVTGLWAWGLFLPLMFFSLLAPGVVTSLLEGPLLWRPVLGLVPSVTAAAIALVMVRGPDSWQPLVLQSICGGAALVFLFTMFAAVFRRTRRGQDSQSFKSPLP